MIPAEHALRCCLALKLWSMERKSHVMALVADEGSGALCRLERLPQKELPLGVFLAHRAPQNDSLSGRLAPASPPHRTSCPENPSTWIFIRCPTTGNIPWSSGTTSRLRSRRQPSILVFLAQDADSQVFCYSNADLRKGEEAEEVFQFIAFWKRAHGQLPRHLVFDSKLTTYQGLARLDKMQIPFITLRRRSRKLLKEIALLPRSAWRTIELDVPTRKYRTPRVYEQTIPLAGRCSGRCLSRTSATTNPPSC